MNKQSEAFLAQYLNSLEPIKRSQYASFSADFFCADEHNANLCAQLIKQGDKRASCSLEYWYTHRHEPRPTVGHLQVVTDWSGVPVCIIELTHVSTCRFCDVDTEFAFEEGEGDKSLTWWRETHWQFFTAECKELGITPTEDMPLVQERFKMVYQ